MSKNHKDISPEYGAILLEIIDALLRVTRREHLFSLLQGPFQYLFPHEVMVCGVSVANSNAFYFDSFSSTRYFTEQHARVATSANTGLIWRTMMAWREHKRPIRLGAGLVQGDHGGFVVPFSDADEALCELELRNLVAHGMCGRDGNILTFFCFSRIPEQIESLHAYMLELIVPHLHSAFIRSNSSSNDAIQLKKTQSGLAYLVTAREQEVLLWLNTGKTNWEIAQILDISPNTVKNHVQNILRKLEVQNRSHAAVKASELGLIKN